MKEILHVMKLDFLSVIPTAIAMVSVMGTLAVLGTFFFTPFCGLIASVILPIFLIGPQQTFDSKYGHKLHGILPIQRKSITRGRFALYAVMFFFIEIFVILLVTAAVYSDLNELVPMASSSILQEQQFAFEAKELPELLGTCTTVPMFFCLFFSYMEMTGQIFGRENELKILIVSNIIIIGLTVAILTLTDAGILPYFSMPDLPDTIPEVTCFAVIGNIVVGAICTVFCEITAHVVSKREL